MTCSDARRSGPLVSIITPAHNAAAFLAETAACVRAQRWTEWEWLIADDASTDATAAMVRDMGRDDLRVRLIEVPPPNGNAARARNAAMAAARGDYFAFLDADDLWLPEKLARQVEHLAGCPEAGGVCTWHVAHGHGEAAQQKRAMQRFPRSRVVRREEMVFGCPFQTSTLMIRRAHWENVGGMDEDPRLRSGQDYEYFVRLLNTCRIDRIPEVLVRYRVAEGESLSGRNLQATNERGWRLLEVFEEKGLLRREEIERRRAALHYEQAKDNLFHLRAPFRASLWRSLATGRPPREAVVMFALSFLPATLLRGLLLSMRGAINRLRVGV